MLFRLLGIFTLVSYTNAFLSEKISFKYAGKIEPMGYFDPLKISYNTDTNKIKYLREAELQHGRVAMVSFVGLVALDFTSDDLAINQLSHLTSEEQFPFWFSMFTTELGRMILGWEDPFQDNGTRFKIKEDYQPGNLLMVSEEDYSMEQLNKELSNGRLAMFGCLGYIAQELVQQQKIF